MHVIVALWHCELLSIIIHVYQLLSIAVYCCPFFREKRDNVGINSERRPFFVNKNCWFIFQRRHYTDSCYIELFQKFQIREKSLPQPSVKSENLGKLFNKLIFSPPKLIIERWLHFCWHHHYKEARREKISFWRNPNSPNISRKKWVIVQLKGARAQIEIIEVSNIFINKKSHCFQMIQRNSLQVQQRQRHFQPNPRPWTSLFNQNPGHCDMPKFSFLHCTIVGCFDVFRRWGLL